MADPLISVIITNYNYGRYVSKAIRSVFNQSYQNIEIIIINDGSTDNSDQVIKETIRSGPKKNIRYESRDNRGVVYTRNEGIKLASGDYICFLDADDYFNRDYIEKNYKVAVESGADVVYPNWHYVGDWLGRPDTDFPEFKPKLLQMQKLHVTPASLIRKDAIGSHEFEVEKVAEDWDFFIGLSLDSVSFKLAKDNYLNYRIRKGTRSSRSSPREDTRNFVEILQKYKKLYGDSVIDPKKLVTDRHPNIFKRAYRKLVPNVLLASINKDGYVKTLLKIIKKIYSKTTPVRWVIKSIKNFSYNRAIKMPEIKSSYRAKIAVVLHLYYPDMWPIFNNRLANLSEPFDLFVSVRAEHANIDLQVINSFHGETNIVVLPNKGRDVLPFLVVSRAISSIKQYKYILKLHSKKSPHRSDGDKWLNELLDELIPKNCANIMHILEEKKTGAVGPSKHVVSLKRYIGGNRNHMVYILKKITSKETMDEVLLNTKQYPFFGGTMFWCRVDLLRPLLESDLDSADFNPESRQLDMTTAHAVERIMGKALHKITNRNMYTVSADGKVRKVVDKSYDSVYQYVD